jgi:hypothetical protein
MNVAPKLNGVAASPASPSAGTPFSLTGSILDTSPADTFHLTIDWGDGSAPQAVDLVAGTTTLDVQHTFATAGRHRARLTLADDDGGVARATARIVVT